MTDNYEIVFQIEQHCQQELRERGLFSDDDVDRIIQVAVHFFEQGEDAHVSIVPHVVELALQLESTLYVMKLGDKHRAIVSIDADEVFDRLIITLWSYTSHHELHRALEGLVKALYAHYLGAFEEGDGAHGGKVAR